MKAANDTLDYNPQMWVLKNFIFGGLIFAGLMLLGSAIPYAGILVLPVNLALVAVSLWHYFKKDLPEAAARYALYAIGMLKVFPIILVVTAIPFLRYEVPIYGISALAVLLFAYGVSFKAAARGKVSWLYGVYAGLLLYILWVAYSTLGH